MKKILLSTQPKWCEKIIDCIKTIEVRKTRPEIDTPFKCCIYCTMEKAKNDELWVIDPEFVYYANGSVIGEFVCDKIDTYLAITIACAKFEVNGGEVDEKLRYNAGACLTAEEMDEYAKGKTLYGWHISHLKIYDKPKELNEYCTCNGHKTLTRPPKSWCYVEEIE